MDKEKIKGKAEVFLKYDKKVFIKCYNGNYYFASILDIGEDFLYIQSFIGKRSGERENLMWLDIEDIQEYREVGANV